MVGFHLPGDPYFPEQGVGGWLDVEPDDNHEIPLDDDFVENFPDDSDSEPKVNDYPWYHRLAFQGLTPLWAENLGRWIRE